MAVSRSDEAPSVTGAWSRRLTRREFLRRLGVGGLGLGVVGGLLGVPLATTARLDGRILHGIAIGGVAVGGLTLDEAVRRLTAAVAAYRTREVRVMLAETAHEWRVSPTALGLEADVATVAAEAFAIGRGRGPLSTVLEQFAIFARGRHLSLPVALDDAHVAVVIEGLAANLTVPPVDARFAFASGGGLTVIPERAGEGFVHGAVRSAFEGHAALLETTPLTLQLAQIPAAITAAQLQAHAARAAAFVAQPFTLRDETNSWALSREALLGALGFRGDGTSLQPTLDAVALRPFLAPIAAAVARPPDDAKIARDAGGRYAIVAEHAGRALDEAATIAAMEAALRDGLHETPLALVMQPPTVTAAALDPLYAQLDHVLNTPLRVTFAEYTKVFTRDDIAPLITILPGSAEGNLPALHLDANGVGDLAAALAADLDQEARDAVFAWRDGAVQEVTIAQDGRKVQREPTSSALTTAILAATGTATPIIAVTPPRVPSSAGAAIVITDRLGGGRSDYGWSVPNRKYNVELAIERLDGALIPPDAVFSFNASVGEQTIENGYKEGYGIALVGGTIGDGGEVKTVSSIGGGICQVSTILFQVIYRAGLPIEERNWHLYWIPSYGAAPSGLQGLDATVDSASGLDFKFRNTTGGWLAIEAIADGAELRIALRGVDPGWQITVDEPIITNEQPADPTPVLEKTHDLAPGERIAVEHAVDGFDAANHIRVLDRAGRPLREMVFTSNYYPSRNVTQVGVAADEPLD